MQAKLERADKLLAKTQPAGTSVAFEGQNQSTSQQAKRDEVALCKAPLTTRKLARHNSSPACCLQPY